MDWKRIAVVTAGLAAAGAVVGGLLTGGLIAVMVLVFDGFRVLARQADFVLTASLFGAAVGSVLGPLSAWLLMRHVPLWLAIGGTALGTLAGVGLAFATESHIFFFPLLGFALAALAMRLLVGRKERVKVSV